jgi:hypothetical protein
VKLAGMVRLARTPLEFLREIEAQLASGNCGPDAAVAARMDSESWDQKVEDLSRLVENLNRGERERYIAAGRVA